MIKKITAQLPQVPVIFLTSNEEETVIGNSFTYILYQMREKVNMVYKNQEDFHPPDFYKVNINSFLL